MSAVDHEASAKRIASLFFIAACFGCSLCCRGDRPVEKLNVQIVAGEYVYNRDASARLLITPNGTYIHYFRAASGIATTVGGRWSINRSENGDDVWFDGFTGTGDFKGLRGTWA